MTKTDYVRWLMATFEQVRSEKTANGYVNVPRSIGLTSVVEGKIRLTPDGERVRQSKDRDILFGILAKNILGIDEIMEFLKTTQEPQTRQTYWHSSKRISVSNGRPLPRSTSASCG